MLTILSSIIDNGRNTVQYVISLHHNEVLVMAGYILFEGPSELDGKPIVVIATENSKNTKTGGMVQTWIMRADIEPHTALKTGADSSVCGDCPHRPANGGACYVTVFQAPLAVYRAYKRGVYQQARFGQFAGKVVRIGSYGDPAAVPLPVWDEFTFNTAGITGYTHQWRNIDADGLGQYCMASCDNAGERETAVKAGWRTFRVRNAEEPVMDREVVCPASAEAGHLVTCEQCKACNGNSKGRIAGIVIIAHGAKSKVNAFARQGATG